MTRGECWFVEKAKHVAASGAGAMVVVNSDPEGKPVGSKRCPHSHMQKVLNKNRDFFVRTLTCKKFSPKIQILAEN